MDNRKLIVEIMRTHYTDDAATLVDALAAVMDEKDRAFHMAIGTLSTYGSFQSRSPSDIAEEYRSLI